MRENKLLASLREGTVLSFPQQLLLIIELSIPAIFANISQVLMEYIDSSMVGSLGAQSSAAIGLVSSSTWLGGGILMAAATGFTVQVAQHIGAGHEQKARELCYEAMRVCMLWSFLILATGVAISWRLPGWLGGNAEIADDAGWYFRIFALSAPVVMLVYLAGGLIQATGNMLVPALLHVVMCALDVLFNYFWIFPAREVTIGRAADQSIMLAVRTNRFICGTGTFTGSTSGFMHGANALGSNTSMLSWGSISAGNILAEESRFRNLITIEGSNFGNTLTAAQASVRHTITLPGAGMGVAGAALGTLSAELVVGGILLFYLALKSPVLKKRKGERYHFVRADLVNAARIGVPVGIEQAIQSGAQVVSTTIVAPLGTISIAANSLAVTAEGLCYMPGYGIASAAQTLIGQSIGAGRKNLVRRLSWLTTIFGMIIQAGSGALLYLLAPAAMHMLSSDPQVQALGAHVLRIEAFAEPFFAASIVANGAFRGAGDTVVPTIMGLVSMWAVRLPMAAFLAPRVGLRGVWIAMATELTFRGIIFLIRLSGKKWMQRSVTTK